MSAEPCIPWLSSGIGQTPSDGGCIMQVVDWVDSHGWSAQPDSVHPALRALAVFVSVRADDRERQRLLDFVPRLRETNSDDKVLSVRLAAFCARRVLYLFEDYAPDDDRPRRAIETAEAWCDEPAAAAPAGATRAAAAAWAAGATEAAGAAAAAWAAAAAGAAAAAWATEAAGARRGSGLWHRTVAAAAWAAAAAAAAAAAWAAEATEAAWAAAATEAESSKTKYTGYELLVAVLDEYDRLTGRTNVETVDLAPVAAAMAR